ncbi:hypothetical protein NDU88_006026 [Pleurodeles waltl]|uniref:Uncharacterized protein n=1 Tax=Pleurodeles waltl TaxID=8319 RepID=A0AAV7VNS2_PLEWA|nr:hypothetical protein NDU88_006026 [Pleurodeles waltl]
MSLWRSGRSLTKPKRCRKVEKGKQWGDEGRQVRGANEEENEPNREQGNTEEDKGSRRHTSMEEKTEKGRGQQGALTWTRIQKSERETTRRSRPHSRRSGAPPDKDLQISEFMSPKLGKLPAGFLAYVDNLVICSQTPTGLRDRTAFNE